MRDIEDSELWEMINVNYSSIYVRVAYLQKFQSREMRQKSQLILKSNNSNEMGHAFTSQCHSLQERNYRLDYWNSTLGKLTKSNSCDSLCALLNWLWLMSSVTKLTKDSRTSKLQVFFKIFAISRWQRVVTFAIQSSTLSSTKEKLSFMTSIGIELATQFAACCAQKSVISEESTRVHRTSNEVNARRERWAIWLVIELWQYKSRNKKWMCYLTCIRSVEKRGRLKLTIPKVVNLTNEPYVEQQVEQLHHLDYFRQVEEILVDLCFHEWYFLLCFRWDLNYTPRLTIALVWMAINVNTTIQWWISCGIDLKSMMIVLETKKCGLTHNQSLQIRLYPMYANLVHNEQKMSRKTSHLPKTNEPNLSVGWSVIQKMAANVCCLTGSVE